jgi:hypothetical protein
VFFTNISVEIYSLKHPRTHNQGVAGSIPAGPTQNQEVTTSKVVTFFLVPVWCQDLVLFNENGLPLESPFLSESILKIANDELSEVGNYCLNCLKTPDT